MAGNITALVAYGLEQEALRENNNYTNIIYSNSGSSMTLNNENLFAYTVKKKENEYVDCCYIDYITFTLYDKSISFYDFKELIPNATLKIHHASICDSISFGFLINFDPDV